jgi:hypothetical protein
MRRANKILVPIIALQILFTYFILPYGAIRPLIGGEIPLLMFYLMVMNIVAYITLIFVVKYANWGEE